MYISKSIDKVTRFSHIGYVFGTVLLCSFYCIPSVAQTLKGGSVGGRVTDASTGEPLEFATISLEPSKLYTTTDNSGNYSIDNIPAGKVRLKAQFFGMADLDTTLTLTAGQRLKLDIALKETSFRLEKVTVTATRSEAGKATASEISRQAMDHLQTGSLGDALVLLPGIKITNPTLNTAQTISIRNTAGSSMSSLGTAILVDGAPTSNNSNMQFLSSSIAGSLKDSDTGASGADTGVDTRTLSTDNVESIDVIVGVPSVEYGDLTSGAVIVRSKAGKSPLTIRAKLNPNIYQASASKGFSLSPKAGDLNLSADYAYSKASLIADNQSYQRASAKALWTVAPWNGATLNTSLTLNYGLDCYKRDLEASGRDASRSDELGVRFNSNGRASIGGTGFLKSLDWILSGSYENKTSRYSSTASNASNLYSTAMEDGLVYTNTPGQRVYLVDSVTGTLTGTEVTNASQTLISGRVLPYSYPYDYDIYGKEVGVYAKVNAHFSKTWESLTDNLLAGVDFKSDGNLGKGAVYSDAAPPWRNISNVASGYRRRNYSDIPFVNQLGIYAEDEIEWTFGERKASLTAGARFNLVNGLTSLDPRVNAAVDILPWLTLRGAWGYASKAPTAIYLYPNYAYLDIINYNHMQTSIPESERMLIATTKVYDASNPDLEIARNRKAELGLDMKFGQVRASVTAYDEYMGNGYSNGLNLNSFIWYQNQQYATAAENPGEKPYVQLDTLYNLFFRVYRPGNNTVLRNQGLEYEVDFGRVDAIRTSFYLNGAWTRGSGSSAGYGFSTRTDSNSAENNIGILAPGTSTSYSEDFITTLRATHNIPQIGFAITLTTQLSIWEKNWTEYSHDDELIGYISRLDGQAHWFDTPRSYSSLSGDPELWYLAETLNDNRFVREQTFPYVVFNLNLSKEIGNDMTASFYVNNIFNNRPLYRYKRSGTMTELAEQIFFGFEMKVNIR